MLIGVPLFSVGKRFIAQSNWIGVENQEPNAESCGIMNNHYPPQRIQHCRSSKRERVCVIIIAKKF